MGHRRAVFVFLGLFAFLFAASRSPAQQPYITVRAGLLKAMRSSASSQGATFLLHTISNWQQGDCTVSANTVITGVVTSLNVSGSGARRVAWGLRFDPVSCAGDDARQITPLLIALQVRSKRGEDTMNRLEMAQIEDQAIGALSAPHLDLDPASNTLGHSAGDLYNIRNDAREKAQPVLKTGEVDGVRKVSMELPKDTPVTTLVSSSREVQLPEGTEFVLRMVELPAARPLRANVAQPLEGRPSPGTRTPAPKREVDITEVCVASGCKQVVAVQSQAPGQAAWTLPATSVGYEPRLNQTLTTLDDDATVHYLGPDQLLLSFPLHVLLRRTGSGGLVETRRVRAVLVSAADGHVLAIKEWTVGQATGAYLWQLGSSRVLVHVGDDLITYGPGLTEEEHFALPGPVAYLSASSDGSLILAAVVHERHSAADHQHMADLLGPNVPVPEDFDLIGLNGSLREISTRLTHEEPPRPALLPGEIVEAERRRVDLWDIRGVSLTGERKRLAQVRSTCGVQVSSLPGSLLLVRSCEGSKQDPAFRVLDAHGATLMRGLTPYGDLLQEAVSDTGASEVAIASSHFVAPRNLALGVRAAEFDSLAVRVFRTSDGKQVFAATPSAGSAASRTMALSPAGDHVAVLTNDGLRTYAIH